MRRLLLLLISSLTRLTYQPKRLDSVNKKLIKPVPNLIIEGLQYYEFVQQADMPINRFVHYLDFREETQMGMSREQLLEYIEAIKKANNDSDASTIGTLAYMMGDTIANCTPVEVLYNIASLRYFDSEEDISCYDLDYNEAKIRKFKSIKDKSFFLRHLLETTLSISGEALPEDISRYLNDSMVKVNAFRHILSDVRARQTETDLKAS
ncbi:MAG: hypothetical protein ACFB2Y_16965 [Fulvivirga sp.]